MLIAIEATSEMTKQAFEKMMASIAQSTQDLLDEHEADGSTSLYEMVNTMVLSLAEDGASMKEMQAATRFFVIGWAAGARFGKVEK